MSSTPLSSRCLFLGLTLLLFDMAGNKVAVSLNVLLPPSNVSVLVCAVSGSNSSILYVPTSPKKGIFSSEKMDQAKRAKRSSGAILDIAWRERLW